MDKTILEEIGLTKGEIKVYLALLELENSTSGLIIIKSKVSRSKVYEILQRLKEKGLVSEVIKNQVRSYQALSPTKILEYLKNKEQAILSQKQKFETILPALLKTQKASPRAQYVKTYVGYESIKTFYYEMVEDLGDEEYLGINFSRPALENKSLLLLLHHFHKERAIKGIKPKILCTTQGINQKLKSGNVYELRFTDQAVPTDISIFKDTVAMFSWTGTPIVFAITCKETAEKYRTFFQEAWKKARKI